MGDSLERVFDTAVSAGPTFMKAFMRGFTGSNEYDTIFDELIEREEANERG